MARREDATVDVALNGPLVDSTAVNEERRSTADYYIGRRRYLQIVSGIKMKPAGHMAAC